MHSGPCAHPPADAPLLEDLRSSLLLLLDQSDYTAGACSPTDMVAACLDVKVIEKVRAVLARA